MPAAEFTPGDVVRLKSGGPPMTVSKLDTFPDGTTSVFCDWFEGTQQRGGVFRVAILEHADREESDDEEGDTREAWVVAEEVLPVGAENIPRQQWRYLELWLSEDPLLTDHQATRMAKTPDDVNGWLHKMGLEVEPEQGAVAQVANGIVLGTRRR